MRLELNGSSDPITVDGDYEIVVPEHFNVLSDREMVEVNDAPQRSKMILACGRVTRRADIDFITGDGTMMSAPAKYFPPGQAWPIDHGHTVQLDASGSPQGRYEIAADWLISISTVIVKA
jgi:hypothetical protein